MQDHPPTPAPASIRDATAAGIWDDEWERAWKAHPANPWFAYEADVYVERIGRAPSRRTRMLKTDAFDEACGRGRLSAALGAELVIADVSPRIVRHAARALDEGIVACAADVRRLPFAASTFDVVVSTSTLDHFEARGDIAVALAELGRVLHPAGRLFLTLDNPANPLLRMRKLLYAALGPIGGLIPFRMGLTLSRAALVAAAEEVGLEVRESGYVVHAPRVLGLWLGVWAARRKAGGAARRLLVVLRAVERTARRLPTRRWTAHFIYAECRPRPRHSQ
jgi:SAM-dependent methyltransferase